MPLSVFTKFVEGGVGFMTIITLLLVALIVAAFKAPKWAKEIGLAALTVGFLATMIGYVQMFDYFQSTGELDVALLFGGLKVSLITPVYGSFVYLASLVVRVINKPRK